MKVRRNLQEASALGAKSSDGTYPIRIITEGEGSTGVYTRQLLESSVGVFSGTASYLNHPIDPEHPERRDVNTLAGRIGEAEYRVDEDGVAALHATYKPRKEYAELVEEFGDVLGLSIFCGARGTVLESGKLDVEEFDASDPYRSVDIVVAAGRGGRFEKAMESYRAIESSLGHPVTKPDATSAAGTTKKEGNMEEVLAELKALTALFSTFVTESKAAATASAVAEADADAIEKAVEAAVVDYDAKIAAIAAVEGLLPSQVASLRADAKEGADITKALESAKATIAEFKAIAESADTGFVGRVSTTGTVTEASAHLPKGW